MCILSAASEFINETKSLSPFEVFSTPLLYGAVGRCHGFFCFVCFSTFTFHFSNDVTKTGKPQGPLFGKYVQTSITRELCVGGRHSAYHACTTPIPDLINPLIPLPFVCSFLAATLVLISPTSEG